MRVFLTVQQRDLRVHAKENPQMTRFDLQVWLQRTCGKHVGRSTIGKIINSKIEETLNDSQQRRRKVQHPEMESTLYDFILQVEDNASLSDELLWLKANEILEKNNPGSKVSLSWVQRFKWRHGIKRRKLHGEAGSVEKQSVAHHRRLLQELLDEYDPADVYNFDETSLFFRMKPSQTLATKKMRGKKKDKTRITIALCCNMDGSAKEAPVIINNSQKPRCFKGHDVSKMPLRFYANQKAWMNSAIFSDWLKKFNAKMHGRSVLLLVDNASSHVNLDLSNVRVHYLPPNTTSELQPLDAGIINSFKANYRRCFLRWMLLQIEGNTRIKHIDLLSSITYIIQAWKDVSPTTISNCWVHTGIVPAPKAALLKQQSEPRRCSIINELDELIQKLALDDPMPAESYVSIDDAIDIDVDCTEPEDVEHVADNEEETVFTHREALVAASKLSVYAALHCLEKSQLSTIVGHSQRALTAGMKQIPIDCFFSCSSLININCFIYCSFIMKLDKAYCVFELWGFELLYRFVFSAAV
jgi:hypothetical protein